MSDNSFYRIIQMAYELLCIKITGNRVQFFHECCWPEFDVLVSIIRPEGIYSPAHDFSVSAELIQLNNIPLSKSIVRRIKRIIYKTVFERYFNIYNMPTSANIANYALSAITYPKSITQIDLNRCDTMILNNSDSGDVSVKRALIVGGEEALNNNEELVKLYHKIVKKLIYNNFVVYYKEHPTDSLGFKSNYCIELDRYIPAEMIEIRFEIIIASTSTALARMHGNKKISVMNALHGWKENIKSLRMKCLMSVPGSNEALFIKNIDDIDDIIL